MFLSCTDSLYNFTYNWVFEIQQTINTSPLIPGYPKTNYIVSRQKGLTISEADKITSLKTNFTVTKSFGTTIRVDNICHKYIESAYVPDTTKTIINEIH